MDAKSTKVYVDSISSGICRLLSGDDPHAFTLPLGFLPDGVSEGDVLRMVFKQSPGERARDRDEVKKLRDSLGSSL